MKGWRSAFIVAMLAVGTAVSAPQEPELQIVDEKVSINVENMALGRLLRLWDQATGMHSRIPPELTNRSVSVRFSRLTMDEAVRKIFERESLDYVFIRDEGIIVTRASEPAAVAEGMPEDVQQPQQIIGQQEIQETPQVMVQLPQRPPPIVQTPFGPIVNPRGRPVVQLPPVPGEAPALPFFAPEVHPTPPAGAPNGPAYNNLFAPISIYQAPSLPPLR